MSEIRACIIGTGYIAISSHLLSYRKNGVKVVAVMNPKKEKAEAFAKEYGIPSFYDDAAEMLDKEKVDVVSVCTPNSSHYYYTMLALDRCKNVLCEKPPAVSYQEAKEMEDKAREKGLVLTYAFQKRYKNEMREAKRIVDEGKLGKIYHTEIKWLRRRGIPTWGHFTDKKLQRGGPLLDIGVHVLDIALNLLSYPKVKYVTGTMSDLIGKREREEYSVEDGFFGSIYFENGTSLTLSASFAINQKEKEREEVILFGDKMGLSVFPLELYDGENTIELKTDKNDEKSDMISSFIESVENKNSPLVKSEEGSYIMRVVDALYLSAERNEPIFL